jgi:hypothetical protein
MCRKMKDRSICEPEFIEAMMVVRERGELWDNPDIIGLINLDKGIYKCLHNQLSRFRRAISMSESAVQWLHGLASVPSLAAAFKHASNGVNLGTSSGEHPKCDVIIWHEFVIKPNFGKPIEELGLAEAPLTGYIPSGKPLQDIVNFYLYRLKRHED